MNTTLLEWWPALGGGLLIGLSAALLMGLNGQILGVSGITAGAIDPKTVDRGWRFALLAGMVLAGLALSWLSPAQLHIEQVRPLAFYVLSGLAVGYGARLGSGCPSGHGICGLSRLSPRSLVATATFMTAAIFTVLVLKMAGVAP
jgi:uncharacterized membrane protein YedE/YeeE